MRILCLLVAQVFLASSLQVIRLDRPGQLTSKPKASSKSHSPAVMMSGSTVWLLLLGPLNRTRREAASSGAELLCAATIATLVLPVGPAGPNRDNGVMPTLRSNSSLVNDGMSTSSPTSASPSGMALLLGSGSPTFTGMSSVSRIHCSDGSLLPPVPIVPRPRSATVVVGVVRSLVVSTRLALRGPAAVGLKVIGKVAVAPGATVIGSVPVRANSA